MTLKRKEAEQIFITYANSKGKFKRLYLIWCLQTKIKTLLKLKKTELQERLRLKNLPISGNKPKLVDSLVFVNMQTKKCGRALNGKKEDKMLTKLVDLLKEDKYGMIKEYKKQAKITNEIVKIEKAGGRGKHYDLVFVLDDGKKIHVEVKSTECGKLNEVWAPWSEGVQAINGPGQRFTLARKYAELWYKKNIRSGEVNKIFGLKNNIPDYDEWLKNLAFKQGKAGDKWGAELYGKTKQGNTHYNEMKKMKAKFTKTMNEIIEKDSKILKDTVPEAQLMLNETFGQKDVWLRIAGDLDKKPEFKWEIGVPIPKLKEIKLQKTTKTGQLSEDLYVDLIFENFQQMKGICRWGYGNGVANIRFDFK
tara:strand:+ start:109 stop:1200 length:1092 start_codon:yes stop_codon:yes gene_type:complete